VHDVIAGDGFPIDILLAVSCRLTLLKVDTTPALQHLPSKLKNTEYCDE
jgi:hypothetical protein